MTEKPDSKAEERLASVEEALSKSEQFVEKNQKRLIFGVVIIVIIVLGFFGYNRYISAPKEAQAASLMFAAERYFEQDSLNKALNGDGTNLGFLQIIDDFGGTKSSNLAQYYTGISYLKLGEYQKAIDHLNDFSADDKALKPMAYGAIGDAYLELNQPEKAAAKYVEAAKASDNSFTAPQFLLKAGFTYEILKQYSNAVNVYTTIEQDYPKSSEARSIEKYIARAKGLEQS
ncbi:MAG: tol-pal system YbgF family protein [Hyphomicrobiales bacterium]